MYIHNKTGSATASEAGGVSGIASCECDIRAGGGRHINQLIRPGICVAELTLAGRQFISAGRPDTWTGTGRHIKAGHLVWGPLLGTPCSFCASGLSVPECSP